MICIYQKMDCYGSIPRLLFSTSINLLAPFQDALQLPLLLSNVFTCCVWRHVCTPKYFFMYFRLPKVCILCSIAPKTMNSFVFFLSWGHLIFFVSFLETVLDLSILYRDIGQTPEMYFSIVPMCTPCMIRETQGFHHLMSSIYYCTPPAETNPYSPPTTHGPLRLVNQMNSFKESYLM